MSLHKSYKQILENGASKEELIYAGYFDDSYTNKELETIFDSVFEYRDYSKLNLKNGAKPMILLLTGCFSPLHEGHINSLHTAKKYIENNTDFYIAGAYISPAHDSYVSVKKNGTAKCNALKRILFAEKLTDDSDYIMVDRWPALYMKEELNFPYIMDKLKYDIENKFKTNVTIGFVFGEDNIGFGNISTEHHMICIARNHNTKLKNYSSKNMHFVSDNIFEMSSTEKRNNGDLINIDKKQNKPYLLRNDFSFIGGVDKKFETEFINLFKKYFDIVVIDAREQCDITRNKFNKIISMDKRLIGDINFNISRIFNPFNGQYKSKKFYFEEPENIPNDLQNYILIDDDISTGISKNFVMKKYGINKFFAMNEIYCSDFFDVVDLRDFVFGSEHGGLKIENNMRIPYVFPYVNLHSRASMNVDDIIDFSIELTKINLKYNFNKECLGIKMEKFCHHLMEQLYLVKNNIYLDNKEHTNDFC